MRHIQLAITSFAFLVNRSHQAGTYKCKYAYEGSSSGTRYNLTEDDYDFYKRRTELYYECERMATMCTFGPNDEGEFTIDQVVSDATAETCNRDKCICTSHDAYFSIRNERLEQARFEEEPDEPEPVVEEEEEVIRPVEPEPETEDDVDAESDEFRFRLKPAPLSMEEYDSYHLDDVYIVCEVGTTNALLTLNEF